jgi:hypothetical protein
MSQFYVRNPEGALHSTPSAVPQNGEVIAKMTLKEVAAEFRVTVRTIQNWVKKLGLPVVSICGKVYAEPEALRAWWEHQKNASRQE